MPSARSRSPPGPPRKLVYIEASENAPTYFLHIVGINSIPITTNSVSEAAPIDLVLVFDTSESMGVDTTGFAAGNFDPSTCNTNNDCYPLRTAKDAANKLIDTLYDGYDRVAVVTFDQVAITHLLLSSNMTDVKNAITAIPLHDDAPGKQLFSLWWNHGAPGNYNPVNPEDRNDDGSDDDSSTTETQCNVTKVDEDGNPDPLGLYWLDWDYTKGTPGVGIPCDKPDVFDAFDMNQDGKINGTAGDYTSDPSCSSNTDVCLTEKWMNTHKWYNDNTSAYETLPMSILSTCTGCGIRVATANLVSGGRSNAVWVMVVLSDGVANLTDTPQTFPENNGVGIPAAYVNGYCGGSLGNNPLWSPKFCVKTVTTRYCINPTPLAAPTPVAPGGNCPPGALFQTAPVSPPYAPEDYARDMGDRAAFTHPTALNSKETLGSDMAIYTIGLGEAAVAGAPLLRYMAAVGDDGNRDTDPCNTIEFLGFPKKSCGQYYFAQNADELGPIFDSIASRIYTKITY